MLTPLFAALSYLSRICGFDTIDAFPPGHTHARTRWERAYFDIASDQKPEQIERKLCAAISNTPGVFAHITNPTPAMQRALIAAIETRVRREPSSADDLVLLLIKAYRSAHIHEGVPGLRAAIAKGEPEENIRACVRGVVAFLADMPAPFGVIDSSR